MSFWDAFFLCLIYVPLVLLWGPALFDIFDRADLSAHGRRSGSPSSSLVPFVGTLLYLIGRRPGTTRANRREIERANRGFAGRYAPSSTAAAAVAAGELHDRGKLTDGEFSIEKERLLGHQGASTR